MPDSMTIFISLLVVRAHLFVAIILDDQMAIDSDPLPAVLLHLDVHVLLGVDKDLLPATRSEARNRTAVP